jgi:DNA-binding transcriptional ArsR family regulator
MTKANLQHAAQLRATAEKLLRIASDLEKEATNTTDVLHESNEHTRHRFILPGLGRTELLNRAKFIYESRRERARHFDADIFGEPAWDIILDLLISKLTEKQISITSACLASGVPPTTALRWIGYLEDLGIVEREECLTDNRRKYVKLSDSAFSSIKTYFANEINLRTNRSVYLDSYTIAV